jgi:hypothetical protein
MIRYAIVAVMMVLALPSATSFALTKDAKMATCKFGADEQKLQGAERKKFMDRCMSDKDDPRGPATPKAQ